MSLSNCMSIVNEMSEDDASALLEKLDAYQAAGADPAEAARMAARDLMAEVATDRQATVKQIRAAIPPAPPAPEPVRPMPDRSGLVPPPPAKRAATKPAPAAATGEARGAVASTLPVDQGEMDFGGTLMSQNPEDFFDDDQIAEMRARSVVKAKREAAKPAPIKEQEDKLAGPEVSAQGPKERSGTVKRADYEGEATGNASIDPETQEVLRERIRQIAGDVKVLFDKTLTGGQYDWADQVITLALADNLPLGTEYHEALHAVFKAIDANDKQTLYRGLNTSFVKRQLRELLKDSPESLKKIDTDAEELAAYAFQFWKLGKLKLGPDTLSWMEKLQKLFTRVLEYLKDEPSFEKLMTNISNGYYRNGGPSPLELAIARNSRGEVRQVMADATRGLLSVYDKLLGTNDDRLRESGNGALGKIGRLLYTQVGEKTETRGLAQEIPVMTARWMNEMAKVMGNDAAQTMRTLEAMAMGDESSDHAKQFRSYLNKIHNYLRGAGVDVGYMKGYVPLQWSGDKIRANEDGFKAMLARHQKQIDELNKALKKTGAGKITIDSITEMMMNRNLKDAVPTGDLFDPDTGVPTAHHVEDRVFSFLKNADRRPFVEDNLIGTMGQYVKQVVKHAEYARRFGPEGKRYENLLREAKATGATQEQLDLVRDSKDAIFGAKYNRMDPKWRKILGGVQTYQNLRVLGMAIFSSVADPLAIGVRTGDFGEAWGAFKFAVKNIVNMKDTDLKLLADDIGAVNELGTIDSLMSLYGGFEVEGQMKRANDLLFKLNGLDGLARALRVYAVGAGLRFIQRADDRALAELGLQRADLKFIGSNLPVPAGQRGAGSNSLAVRSSQFRELGMTPTEATKAALKMQTALNRFVDESVLRPNAMERPNWANDPMFSLLFHLKQFIFSFHKIVSKKLTHEMEEGGLNAQMALSAAAFIPLMGASAYVKDMIQFAGDVPANRDFMHYLGTGANRSGFMGPSVLITDPASDMMKGMNPLGGAVGPTGSQALEAVQAIANPTRFGAWLEEAFPFSSIWKRWND